MIKTAKQTISYTMEANRIFDSLKHIMKLGTHTMNITHNSPCETHKEHDTHLNINNNRKINANPKR